MPDPTITAAGITVAADLLTEMVKGLSSKHDIGAAMVNATPCQMSIIQAIHTHHGQFRVAPPPTIGPLPMSVEEEKSVHKNIALVELKGSGAGVSEAIFGYEFSNGGKTYELCFYMKHGQHLEAGAALWQKGQKVHGEDYGDKIHKAAESLIHTIQKGRPQTCYSKDGAGAYLVVDGIRVSHSSGETLQFLIESV